MTENPVFRLKHIKILYFYTKYVDYDGLNDDVLMKPLSWVKFEHFQDNLGVVRKDLP